MAYRSTGEYRSRLIVVYDLDSGAYVRSLVFPSAIWLMAWDGTVFYILHEVGDVPRLTAVRPRG